MSEEIALRAPHGSIRDRRRLGLCLLSALGLHALISFLRWSDHPTPLSASAVGFDAQTEVSLEEGRLGDGKPPGGGSEAPVPNAPPSAPEQPVVPKHVAPRVPRAEVTKERPSSNDAPSEPEDDPLLAGADLLAAAEGAEPLAPRPRAARKLMIESHSAESATAVEAAQQVASPGSAAGTGFGANGGPGGTGRGTGGVIGKRFAFGGPSGSFRADVCFIEPTVKSLKQITSCPVVATFFTDFLNIPPRKFNEGFPGISDRTEWFAIKYRGKFKVTEPDVYTFRLLSDDGSQLTIDGYSIIDNDGQHEPRPKDATITLEAGEHEFSVFYYQGPAEWLALQLFVKRFQGVERLFGPVI
jgi:hypothetical protein